MANPQMTSAIEARAKRYGQWSVKEEKLRITYKDSEESVLFEDTSSISYLKIENPNMLMILLGTIVGIGVMVTTDMTDFATSMVTFLIPFAIGIVMAFTNKIKYDNVAIETRGGKIIRFSVDASKGKDIMEKIEEEKRNWEASKK